MTEELKKLKKIINYRISYTGTKETDILYKRKLKNKIDSLNQKELLLLASIFNEISDIEIFNILSKKIKPPKKYYKILIKLINE